MFFALFNSLFTFLTFVQSCVSLKEVLTRKKILLFSPIIGGTKLKFMHLFVRTSPINRFCFDFQFYLLLILRWAPPNSACLFKLPLLRTWASSSQKFNHFGNRLKTLKSWLFSEYCLLLNPLCYLMLWFLYISPNQCHRLIVFE